MHPKLWAALALCFGTTAALAVPLTHDSAEPQLLHARNIVDSIADSYDFVVVGGGLAGLVLGARLSEDTNHTVLVLEAGGTGDDLRERIDTPGDTYYQSLWPTALNWAFETTNQTNANNQQVVWPRGKVLGGSAAINGLYMIRPSEIEINAWQAMLGDMEGAENWSWDSLYAAMKKSETFTPPDGNVVQEAGITWDASSHGTDGPIHMSYPGYTFPQVGQWTTAMQNAGIDETLDPYSGQNWGAYVATSCINPTNWTRSYSRSGYLDALSPRSNYAVLANAQVTRLLFNSSSPANNLTANAVEYTLDGGATKLTVNVNKEVILAGGSVGSPTVLLYSGVGPKDVLSAAGIPILSELPGVGQHLQDHLSVSVQWSTDQPTAGSVYVDNTDEQSDPVFLSYVNSAVAYANSTALFGSGVGALQASIINQAADFNPDGSSDETVIAGYKAIYDTTVNTILTSPVAQIELLFANNADGSIRITVCLQHPFSQGRIYITSSNPMDYPTIDPNYLSHPADLTILREGLKLARRVGEAAPLSASMINETLPGLQVQSDQDWEDWLKGQISTEFHPCGSCAMLPLNQGGVVDANLHVYGLANVRVADASVPPIDFAAHLMVSTYGLAEQASHMIRAFHNGVAASKPSSTSSGKGGGVSSTASSTPNPAAAASATTTPALSWSETHHSARNVGIGVGVGVPLGLISLAALFWFLRRRRPTHQPIQSGNYGIVGMVPSTEALDQHELDESIDGGSLFKYGAVPQGEKDYRRHAKKESKVGVFEVDPGVD